MKTRGRPKGSKNKPKTTLKSPCLEKPQIKPKRMGRPKGSKNKVKTVLEKLLPEKPIPAQKRMGRPKGSKNKKQAPPKEEIPVAPVSEWDFDFRVKFLIDHERFIPGKHHPLLGSITGRHDGDYDPEKSFEMFNLLMKEILKDKEILIRATEYEVFINGKRDRIVFNPRDPAGFFVDVYWKRGIGIPNKATPKQLSLELSSRLNPILLKYGPMGIW